jgi:hypothetical protein
MLDLLFTGTCGLSPVLKRRILMDRNRHGKRPSPFGHAVKAVLSVAATRDIAGTVNGERI